MSLGYQEAWPEILRYQIARRQTPQPDPSWQIRQYERVMGLPPPANHETATPAAIQFEYRNRRNGDPLELGTELGLRRKARDAARVEGPRPKRRGRKQHV